MGSSVLKRQPAEQIGAILSGIGLGVIGLDLSGTVTYASEVAARLLGLRPAEMAGRRYHTILEQLDAVDERERPAAIDHRPSGKALRGETPEERIIGIVVEGRRRWLACSERGDADAPSGLIITLRDATAMKRDADAQRQSEQRLQAMFDNAAMGIVEVDPDGRFTAVNRKACQILGYECDDLLGTTVHDLTAPEDRARSDDLNAQLNAGQTDRIDYEKRYLRRDGSRVWVHVTVSAVRDASRRLLRAIATIEDIDERKRTETALQESEAKLQLIINRAPGLISYIDHNYRYEFINNAYEEWFGLRKADCVDRPVVEVLGEKAFAKLQPYMRQALAGETVTYEDWTPYRTGTRFIHASYIPDKDVDGKVRGFVVLVNDLTEREQLVEQLSRSVSEANRNKAQLEAAFEAMQDGVVVFDMTGNAVLVNEAEARICGYASPQEMKQDLAYFAKTFELMTLDGRKLPVEEWPVSRVLRGESITDVELRGRRTDTRREWFFSFSGEPVYDEDGRQALAILITSDITERKQAEEQVLRYQERLETAQSAAKIGNWDTDVPTGRIWWSPETYRIYGIPEGTPMTLDRFLELVHPDDLADVREHAMNARRGEGVYEIDHRIIRPDGQIRHVHEHGRMFFDDAGKPSRMVGIVQDITERKRTEEELREVRESLEEAQHIAKLGSWEFDPGTGKHRWSDETYRIFGLDPGSIEITTEYVYSRVHPDDRELMRQTVEGVGRRPSPASAERRVIMPDGSERWVLERAVIVNDERGAPAKVVGTVQDVTERKMAEIALRESEERFRAMFSTAAVGMAMASVPEGRFLMINQEMAEIVGYPAEELIGRTYLDITHPEDQEGNTQAFKELLSGKIPYFSFQKRYIRKDGAIIWAEVNVSLVRDSAGTPLHTVGVIQDITARKEAEEALRRSAEEVQKIMDVVPVAIWVSNDPECRSIVGNQTANAFYEAEEGENVSATTTPVRRFFRDGKELAPEELPMQYAALHNTDVQNVEFEVLMPSGARRTLWGFASPLREADGQPRGAVAAFVDITERKQAEQALKTSEERFRTLFTTAAVGMVLADLQGNIVSCNNKMAEIVGYRVEDIVGRSFESITHPDDLEENQRQMRELAEGRRPYFTTQKRYVRKDGSIRWANVTVSLVRDAQGAARNTSAIIEDITDRKDAEDKVLQAQKSLEEAQRIGHIGSWEDDLISGELHWSSECYKIFGMPEDAALDTESFFAMVHPEDRERVLALSARAITGQEEYNIDHRIVRPDGTVRYVHQQARVSFDEQGRATRMVGITQDITERKELERTLFENEAKFRMMAEAMPQIVWTAKPDGEVDYYNARWEEFTGVHRRDGEGWGWAPAVHPEDAPATEDAWLGAVRTGELYEIEHRIRDSLGEYRWLLSRGVPMRDSQSGEVIKWFGTATDIHEQKQAEAALRESEQSLKLALQSAKMGTWSFDLRNRLVVCDERCRQILGVADQEFTNEHFINDIMHPDDRDHMIRTGQQAVAERTDYLSEYRVIVDGEIKWVQAVGKPTFAEDGTPLKLSGIITDITERKLWEIALQESETRFKATFEQAAVGIVHIGLDGTFLRVNQEMCRITGYAEHELLHLTFGDITHPEDIEQDKRYSQELLEGRIETYQMEKRYIRKDGTPIWINLTGSLKRDTAGKPEYFIGVIADISDRKQALALRDEFLSIASHELKTPVTSVKAFLQAIEMRMHHPEKFDFEKNAEYMQLSIKQVDRLAALINDLLDVTRINKGKLRYQFAILPLGPMVAETVERLSASFPSHIVHLRLQDLTVKALLDPLRFEQALTNIVTNAVKYSPSASRIDISMSRNDGKVVIEVTDHGQGISPEQQAHIFDLYYRSPGAVSTRVGGLGVGLFISRSIVQAHGGDITVRSEPGEGSTFTITLPAVEEAKPES